MMLRAVSVIESNPMKWLAGWKLSALTLGCALSLLASVAVAQQDQGFEQAKSQITQPRVKATIAFLASEVEISFATSMPVVPAG